MITKQNQRNIFHRYISIGKTLHVIVRLAHNRESSTFPNLSLKNLVSPCRNYPY